MYIDQNVQVTILNICFIHDQGLVIRVKDERTEDIQIRKVMWDRSAARARATYLDTMENLFGPSYFLGHSEEAFQELKSWLDPALNLLKRHTRQEPCRPEQRCGILRFADIPGESPVKTDFLDVERDRHIGLGEWVIERHGYPYKQAWRWPLKKSSRIRFVKEIVRQVGQFHGAGKVHGDLNPENIRYDKKSGLLALVEYTAFDPKGSDYWNSPWHEDLGVLPPEADIYMTFLWAARFLEDIGKVRRYIKSHVHPWVDGYHARDVTIKKPLPSAQEFLHFLNRL